jgi:hypothetical protein
MNLSPPEPLELVLVVTSATCRNPNTQLGSCSTLYSPAASCPPVVKTFTASTSPSSGARYCAPIAIG